MASVVHSASVSAICEGGWRFAETEGNWNALPVTVDVRSPNAPIGCEIALDPEVDITATDTWNGRVSSSSAQEFEQAGPTLEECDICPDCQAANPPAIYSVVRNITTEQNYISTLTLLPDLSRGVVRLNGDYLAMLYRFGFPSTEHSGVDECCEWFWENCEPPDEFECEDIAVTSIPVHPSLEGALHVVGASAHAIENPFNETIYAPYFWTANTRTLQEVDATIHTPGACPSPDPINFPDTCDTCECWDSLQFYKQRIKSMGFPGVERRTSNPSISGYLDHAFSVPRYINTWATPHNSYFLFFPSLADPHNWQVFGSKQNSDEYWLPLRQQYASFTNSVGTTHPLPSDENFRRRPNIVSEPIFRGALSGHVKAQYIGELSAFWGVHAFDVENIVPAATLPITSASASRWSAVNATLAHASEITITPSDAEVIVSFDLSDWDVFPFMFAHIAKAIQFPAFDSNVLAAEVYLVAQTGERVLITDNLAGETASRPIPANDSHYAGSWAQDFLLTHGADAIQGGVSQQTFEDPELATALQLNKARTSAHLEYRLTLDDVTATPLAYPTLHSPTTKVYPRHISGQACALIYDDGPGLLYGHLDFWNEDAVPQRLLDSPQKLEPSEGPMSLVDYFCFKHEFFSATHFATGLDSALSGLYDEREGQERVDSAHARYAFAQPRPSEDETYPVGGRWLLVNSYREGPPLACFPRRSRDSVTLADDTGYDQLSYSLCVGPQYYVSPGHETHVLHPGFDPPEVTEALDPQPVSEWYITFHDRIMTNSEPPYQIWRDALGPDARYFANAHFWHGYYCALSDPGEAGPFDLEIGDNQRHIRAVIVGGHIHIETASNRLPLVYVSRATSIEADDVRLALDRSETKQTLAVMYSHENEVYVRFTDNEGVTFSMATALGTGRIGDMEIARHGLRYIYWIDGTTVKGKILDREGNAVVAEVSVLTIDADTNIAVREFVTGSGKWMIEMLAQQSGSLVALTSENGTVFS